MTCSLPSSPVLDFAAWTHHPLAMSPSCSTDQAWSDIRGLCILLSAWDALMVGYTSSFKIQGLPLTMVSMALVVKNLPANTGDIRDAGLIPGSGRSSGGGRWQPTPVFLPGNPWTGGLAGYSPWGCRVGQYWSNLPHRHTCYQCKLETYFQKSFWNLIGPQYIFLENMSQ